MQRNSEKSICGSIHFPYPFGMWIPYSLLSYGNQSGILKAKIKIDDVICSCDNNIFVIKILARTGREDIDGLCLQYDEMFAVAKMTIQIGSDSCDYLGIPYPEISLTTGRKMLFIDNAEHYTAGDVICTYGIFVIKRNEYFAFKIESDDNRKPVYVNGIVPERMCV